MGNSYSSNYRYTGRRITNHSTGGNKNSFNNNNNTNDNDPLIEPFKDLTEFPPEIAISILSNLNATDLCLASCVWQGLAEDEILWKGLCHSRWRYTTLYNNNNDITASVSTGDGEKPGILDSQKPRYKSLYMLLDEASLIYSFRPHDGIKYMVDNNIMTDEPFELAQLIHHTTAFSCRSTQVFLKDRRDVLEHFVRLQEFEGISLCDSLRQYFSKIHPPERGDFLDVLVGQFSERFLECNPDCGFDKDNISVVCYSLLLLSVDLYSPHVKNKMTKREFIRNNKQATTNVNRDILSDMYDDVYLNGHVVPSSLKKSGDKKQVHAPMFPFYRPYGAMFEFQAPGMKLNCAC